MMMKARLKIREIAEQKDMGMTKLHNRSEVSYNTVKNVWRNPYHEITLTTISRLAYALGVGTADLIEDVSDEQYQAELQEIKTAEAKRKRDHSPDDEE